MKNTKQNTTEVITKDNNIEAWLNEELPNAELCKIARRTNEAQYESEWYDVAYSVDPLETDPAYPYDETQGCGTKQMVSDILHNPEGTTKRAVIQKHYDTFSHLSSGIVRYALNMLYPCEMVDGKYRY